MSSKERRPAKAPRLEAGVGSGGNGVGGSVVANGAGSQMDASRSYPPSHMALDEAARRVRAGEVSPRVEGMPEGLIDAVRGAEDWHCSAFRIADVCGDTAMSTTTYWLLAREGVFEALGIDGGKFLHFLRTLEPKYKGNAYHNGTHAADVVHSLYCITVKGKGLETLSYGPFELLVCLFSAAIHDYDHRGVNNDFLVRSQDELAMRYNDRSPMENHHLSACFTIMREVAGANFLEDLPEEKAKKFREMVIALVLATDMKRHFKIEKNFNENVLSACRAARGGGGGGGKWAESLNDHFKMVAMQVMLKLADMGCMAGDVGSMDKFVLLLEEEMFCQGDRERREGMNISLMMDREDTVAGGSAGPVRTCNFYSLFIIPPSEALREAFPGVGPFHDNLMRNHEIWRARGEEVKKATGGTPGGGGAVKAADPASVIPGFKRKL